MPSSLTVSRSSALVFSTRPPVSVWGTGTYGICLAVFLGSYYVLFTLCGHAVYFQVRFSKWICLLRSAPTPFNHLFRQMAELSRLRPYFTSIRSKGMLTFSSIGCAFGLFLRSRLTLIRLTLIRMPWSFGEGGSRPLYRYLYLHLLFLSLQSFSRKAFDAGRNAPLPIIAYSIASVNGLMPDYYPCQRTRLVSCYALFK